ncbi:Uncharacterised protein [Klebsiella pneumoniae]|nr:Uncharacterised protein [Klebsiella pneumoniae]
MAVGEVVDKALTKIIQRFFVQPHKGFFARLKTDQIVIRHKEMLAHM